MLGAGEAARALAPLVGEVVAVTLEGAGWDHVAWRVDAADGASWIVRAASLDEPGDADVGDVRREVAVMQLVRRQLGDLVADAVVVDESTGCMAYRRVPGIPLQDLVANEAIGTADVHRLAGEIGALIGAIAAIDTAAAGAPIPVDDAGPDAWLAELPAALDVIGSRLAPAERHAVERFISSAPPAAPGRDELGLAHNDLGGEHVLVDRDTMAITGIIDWSDAAVADPAAELGRLLRDLGGAHLDAVLAGVDPPAARRAALVERAWWYARCLVVEDLAYAVRRRPDLIAVEAASLGALYAEV
jgi:aminoglycoside phosphotransferase (APT) family kinase protein